MSTRQDGPLRFEFDQRALVDQDVTITGLEQPRVRGGARAQ